MEMITFKRLLLGAFSSLLIASCVNDFSEERDKEYANGGNIPLRFTADIGAVAHARVQENAFEEGDEVGLFAMISSTALTEERYVDNLKFKRSSDGEFTSEQTVYYPDDGSTLDLLSYYPYQEGGIAMGESVMPVSVAAEQSLSENYSRSDFLVATLANQAASKTPLNLSYKHKFFRLNIILAPEDVESADALCAADPQLAVCGFYTEASYDFHKDAYSDYAEEMSLTPAGTWTVEDGRLTGKSVILIPQEISAEYQYLTLEVGGKEYRCWIPDNLEMQSGKQSELEITFVPAEDILLGAVQGDIEDWEGDDTVQSGSEVVGKYIDVSKLDFEQSSVYNVLHAGSQVAEICKECLVTEEMEVQAIVAYPVSEGRTDLTKGTVLQILGSEDENIHGGAVSWSTEDNTLQYTPGTSSVRKRIYVLSDGQLTLSSTSEDELLTISSIANVFRDRRGGTVRNYPVVKIGTQYWMRDNLKATSYSDGTEIPKLDGIAEDADGYLLSDEGEVFYTPSVISTKKMLSADADWRMPTWEDWNQLKAYLKGKASSLKAGEWRVSGDEQLTAVTDLSGFNALPVGMWWSEGKFEDYVGRYAAFWTVDDAGEVADESFMMSGKSDEMQDGELVGGTGWAYSIRAIRK